MPTESRQAWQDLARKAEDLGFATLQTADHLGFAEPFAPLVSAADVTTTLRVGTLVINSELHNPVLLARQAATVDLLTDGRLELGLGTGYAEDEHRAAGIPIAPPGERVTRFEASVAILADLLSTGRAEATGSYDVHVDDLGIPTVQQPHPRLLIGGHGRRVLALAARRAQIVQLTGLTHGDGGAISPGGFAIEDIEERMGWLRTAAGERFDDLELSALVQRVVVGDATDVLDDVADRFGLAADVVRASPFLLLGSVDAIVEKLLMLRDRLGISYVTVRETDAFAPVIERLADR